MPKTSDELTQTAENRAERYARAAALLRQWLAETDQEEGGEYDWSAIDAELQDSAMRCQDPKIDGSETK